MSISIAEKKSVIQEFKIHDNDTGSSIVQVAILTKRINALTEHIKIHTKDDANRRGLLILVAKRRKHLVYIRNNNYEQYEALRQKLNLRKVR